MLIVHQVAYSCGPLKAAAISPESFSKNEKRFQLSKKESAFFATAVAVDALFLLGLVSLICVSFFPLSTKICMLGGSFVLLSIDSVLVVSIMKRKKKMKQDSQEISNEKNVGQRSIEINNKPNALQTQEYSDLLREYKKKKMELEASKKLNGLQPQDDSQSPNSQTSQSQMRQDTKISNEITPDQSSTEINNNQQNCTQPPNLPIAIGFPMNANEFSEETAETSEEGIRKTSELSSEGTLATEKNADLNKAIAELDKEFAEASEEIIRKFSEEMKRIVSTPEGHPFARFLLKRHQ